MAPLRSARRARLALGALAVAVALVGAPRPASAVTLTLVSETTPWTGVKLRKYRTSSPAANVWVALVSLCGSHVHVESTKATTSLTTAGAWAGTSGAQIATNGDFYLTSPFHVYGDAVASGVRWPSARSGLASTYASDWYYHHYGWIAFGPDWADFTHTEYVKTHGAARTTGWKPTTVAPSLRPGTLALVSGFPELVVDGVAVTCSSATATTCFPDRSDMRARHPRTASGLTQDKKTLILAVVDGRTSSSSGMYGVELASLMKQLGAYVAFNNDGGGSSQMWVRGQGYVDDASGNNGGGGVRGVANHWGILAGSGNGRPARPGHCVSSAPCQVIGPSGGTIDDSSACFQAFGPSAYWRTVSAGNGGGLHWTNAFSSSTPSNWAWWQVDVQQAGQYEVQWNKVATYAVYAKTRYVVRASGGEHTVIVDQGAGSNGWKDLGTWDFAAGGDQWVAIYDNDSGAVAADQHIVADAIRLVRVGPWCGDGDCEQSETCQSCPGDCGACPSCGDGACNGAETCVSCAGDCGACPASCGDGACDVGETCASCPGDCGACPPTCGDGACNGEESCESCPEDCGACPPACGDGACGGDESCESCPEDCGFCPDPGPDAGPEPAAEPGPEPAAESGEDDGPADVVEPDPSDGAAPDTAFDAAAGDDAAAAGASSPGAQRAIHVDSRELPAEGCGAGGGPDGVLWLAAAASLALATRRRRAPR